MQTWWQKKLGTRLGVLVAMLATVLVATSCSGMRSGMVGQTPAQKFYEASGYLQILEDACNRYADTPTARRDVVTVCAEVSTEAYQVRLQAGTQLYYCAKKERLDPAATCDETDEALAVATGTLVAFQKTLRARLLEAGVAQ